MQYFCNLHLIGRVPYMQSKTNSFHLCGTEAPVHQNLPFIITRTHVRTDKEINSKTYSTLTQNCIILISNALNSPLTSNHV